MAGQLGLLGIGYLAGQLRHGPSPDTADNHDDPFRDELVGRYVIDANQFAISAIEHQHIDGTDDVLHRDNRDHPTDNDARHRLDNGGVGVEHRIDHVDDWFRRRLMSAGPGSTILFLCTGNASRSVIGGAALARRRPDLAIATAGTLVLEGQPMSRRTRSAMLDVGLDAADHRSRQAGAAVLEASSLVIAAAPEHVAWIRREHPGHAVRTATLIHLVRSLSTGRSPLEARVKQLRLDGHDPGPDEEIVDPGGGEVDLYVAVARQIVTLVDDLADRL